jgi:hypothetical protein
MALVCLGMVARSEDAEDVPRQRATPAGSIPTLTTHQRDSVGIVVSHPQAAKVSQRREALGQVLDVSSLVADFGQLEAAAASERGARAELERLQGLYKADAASSLKMVQAAQTEQVRARTQYEVALSTCISRWSAIARLPAEQQRQMIDRAADGHHLLVRASLLGRQSIGEIPQSATLQVDGIEVPAQVIGVTSQGSADLQSAGVLLEVSSMPAGLGPGARFPVTLMLAHRNGVLVPDAALVYGVRGAGVFKQMDDSGARDRWRYVEVPVELLERQTGGWLVGGIASADLVVVRGAGALWSLQAVNATGANEDDDD